MNQRTAFLSLSLFLSGAAMVAAPVAHAQIFGESDEEKAARQQHEDGQDGQINQLGARVKSVEDQVRSLTDSLSRATGANEELGHQIEVLNQKIAQQQKDFAYRLCMVSAQQLGAGGDDQGLNCAAAGSGGPAGAPPQQRQTYTPGAALPPLGSDTGGGSSGTIDATGGAPQQLGRPPGNLGTLSSSGPSSAPPPRSAGGSGQYDTAMNLLARAQYDEAKAAFRGYADANPDDNDLAPQAIYWIGDIDYVQRDYQGAIQAFAEQIKKYPRSSRGPDSMLKLGQSLLAMGQTREGCTTLGALKSKYPQASDAVLALAAGARKAYCAK